MSIERLEDRTLLSVNPIVAENQLPGTPDTIWDISGVGDTSIQGFSTDISVNAGNTVSFKINDTANASYHLDIYRMGYYAGNGARKVATVSSSSTLRQVQPSPLTDPATGLVDCGNWAVSASWAVPAGATSGIYFADVVRDDTGGKSQIFFVVRNDTSTSDLLFKTSDATWEAYNDYGGNSLYLGAPGATGSSNPTRAYAVSYNRPFNDRATAGGLGSYNGVFHAEYPMVRWLEANGYDVSYFTDVDADRLGAAYIEQHKAFLSVGHDEYWSGGERANVEAARSAGVNLAFFSGNEIFWKTRYAASIDGSNTAYRTLVCYKDTHNDAVIDPADPPSWTGTWMDPRFSPPADGGRPQNALSGTLFTVDRGPVDIGTSFTVPAIDSTLRFWRNTSVAGLQAGQTATLGTSVLGYEWDEDVDNGFRPAGLIDMSSTTMNVPQKFVDYGNTVAPGVATHSLTLYKAPSGALVFSAGTVQWSWGLDGNHDDGTSTPDLAMEQATVNLLADMHVQPGTLQAGLVTATASTDAIAPTSAITSPASGGTFQTQTPITISGTATDAGGGVVGGVEVSVDGGATWHPASGRTNWTYTWVPNVPGQVKVMSRAVDDSGNLETPAPGITLTVTGPTSLWSLAAAPMMVDGNDATSIEVGVKIRADVAGFITGIRFYKASTNTGVHVGNLWSSTGQLLATATFSGETSSGWQQVTFSSPVAVTANTVYVASYHTNAGHYSSDTGFFFNTGVDSGFLHALSNTAGGGNGVYLYGSGGFPNQTYKGENYWVDAIFATNVTNLTPAVISQTPASGAAGVAITTAVTAAFNESVQAASIHFTLTDSSNNPVSATVAYNDATHTATLTPNATLANSTTYTATVSGATDSFGNTMTAPVTWSFTTLGAGIYSIWSPTATPAVADEADNSAVEVGVKFRSDVAGYVTGLRFYKGPANTGTHVGNLWTSAGQLLATATFTGETASGWQQVLFSSPVAIAANTTYVASYHTSVGQYSADSGYFTSSGVDSGPLHALANGVDGANGVYLYGAGGFPNQSFNATNYWVDVVFNSTVSGLTPALIGQTPAAGATGVATSSTVTATFNESVQASTISFVLRDASNNLVPAVVTYNDTNHTATLTPNTPLINSTVYTATVSGAKDSSGTNTMTPTSWSFTTAGTTGTAPLTIWSPTSTPTVAADSDSAAVEVGVKFRSDVAGNITGIRFYKGATNTGTHVGNLWTSTGQLLATATFTGETASGWQDVTLSTPVAIVANTTYIASYHTTVGHYAADSGYFATGVNNGPLHALANGVDGGNGVYLYGAGGFPNQTFNSTNYWVDVDFSPAVVATTPMVVSQSPAAGATGVATGSTASVTLNESVLSNTVSFVLQGPGGVTVPASVSYNDTTHTATLTPTAALAYSTTYTATVSGATDSSGNVMAAPVTWSFTTAAAPPALVASIAGPNDGFHGVRGQVRQFVLTATDPSPSAQAGQFTYVVNWGDGSSDTITGPSTTTARHVYTTAANFTASVTATDNVGVVSVPSPNLSVSILAVETQGNNVAVGGTTAADNFVFVSGASAGQLTISLAGTSLGTFTVGASGTALVFGQGGTDSVVIQGTSAADTFIANGSTMTVNATPITGDSIESWELDGLGGNDSFTIVSGTLTIDGGTGTDTVVGPNTTNTWQITGAGTGTLNGTTVLKNVENLTGGSLADTFQFVGSGAVTGKVDGAGGGNTLDYSGRTTAVTVNLQSLTATATGGIANIGALVGSTATDTLVGANASNAWNLTGIESGNINGTFTFSQVENLTGGTGADQFIFNGGTGFGTISGGSGSGTDTLDYHPLAGPVTVNLQTGTANNLTTFTSIESLIGSAGVDTLVGPNAATTWTVTGANAGTVGSIRFSSFENLTGGTAVDTFRISTGSLSGAINGGGGGDILDYSRYTAGGVTVNLQTGAATGVAAGVSNFFMVIGSPAADNLTGDASANVLLGGAGNDTLTGGGGRDLLIGGSGADTLTGGGDAILFGGTTTYYNESTKALNAAAINSIMQEWTGTDPYATRITNLLVSLITSSTFTNDSGAVDTLLGGTGNNQDWFITRTGDVVKNAQPGETITSF